MLDDLDHREKPGKYGSLVICGGKIMTCEFNHDRFLHLKIKRGVAGPIVDSESLSSRLSVSASAWRDDPAQPSAQ